jgi:DNA-binding IclR family transcriptional regulator
MSVIDIQERIRLSRPTLYRLLETLAARGLIRAHGTPQRFSLDYGVGQLAQNWMAGLDPVAAGRPVVERLHKETRESVGLFIIRGYQHICVLELPSPQVLSMARGIGPMDRLVPGASGKVILAFMDEAEIEAVLRELPKVMDGKALHAQLSQIRKEGFWVSRAEVFDGAVGIAAPYFDHSKRVAGSIIVFGPTARFGEGRIASTTRLVVEAAAEVSSALGHVSPGQAVLKPRLSKHES